jgi:ribose transport system substrate-binding protein
MHHRLLSLLALAALLLNMSACGRSDDGKGKIDPAKKDQVEKGKDKAEPGKKDPVPAAGPIKLAFITNNPADFWLIAQKGTEQAVVDLKDKGVDVSVDFRRPAAGSSEEQQRIVKTLLTGGIQGIAISPNDADNVVDFFKNQVHGKVPLLMQDSDVPDPTARRAYLGTHNYRAGRAAGELVLKAAPKGGKIVIFVGKLDVANAIERRQGVLDVLAGRPGDHMTYKDPPTAKELKVGNYLLLDTKTDDVQQEVCQQRAREFLINHPDMACLVGLWEYNPPALVRAVKSAGTKTPIVGFDEAYETLDAIKSGDCFGTIVQNPFEFGRQSIFLLAALAQGDDSVLKNRKDMDEKNRIFIPHRTITPENVDGFYAELRKLKGK